MSTYEARHAAEIRPATEVRFERDMARILGGAS